MTVPDHFGLHVRVVRQPTDEAIEAGAKALRALDGGTRPWEKLSSASKKRWLDAASVVLIAAFKLKDGK